MKTWIPNTKFMLLFSILLVATTIIPIKSAIAGLKVHYSNSYHFFPDDTTQKHRQVIVLKYPNGKEDQEEIIVDMDSIILKVKDELTGIDSIHHWVFKKIDSISDLDFDFNFDFDFKMEKFDSVLQDLDLDIKIRDLDLQNLDSSLRMLDERLSVLDLQDLNIKKVTISSIEKDHAALNKLMEKESQNSLLLKDISYFPNPSLGKFTLNVQSPNDAPISVSIRNLAGQQIFQYQGASSDGQLQKLIDLSDQPEGTYLLQIKQNNQVLNKKIIIE